MNPGAGVLVEGPSDREAVAALALRRGRDLEAERVEIVVIGGAQAIGRHLRRYGPAGLDLRLAGMCDEGEEAAYRRALERELGCPPLSRARMERLGFFVCVADLEDELIRAHRPASVERILAAHGDLTAFRTMQKQPAWRGRPVEQQLRRFMGSGASRKISYARRLVETLDPARAPHPLDGVLGCV